MVIPPSGQMYVSVEEAVVDYLSAKATTLLQRVDKLRVSLRGFTGTYEEQPTIWVENALYE